MDAECVRGGYTDRREQEEGKKEEGKTKIEQREKVTQRERERQREHMNGQGMRKPEPVFPLTSGPE